MSTGRICIASRKVMKVKPSFNIMRLQGEVEQLNVSLMQGFTNMPAWMICLIVQCWALVTCTHWITTSLCQCVSGKWGASNFKRFARVVW